MKKMFMILAAVLLTASVFLPGQLVNAQSPNKMSYQAVVRDLTNHLVTSHSVGMRVSILQGVIPVYIETHAVNTNENGLVSIEIGTGTVISGNFTTINWANGSYFIKTETDPAGGTSYTITGTSQLLSVPYALHAKTVASYIEIDPKVGLNSTNYLSKWNGTSLVSSSIFDNGNVGIGTTGPTFPLTLEKNTFAGLSDILALNNLQSPNSANAVSINFRMRDNVGGGNELVYARIRAISTTVINPNQTGALVIDARTNSATLTEVMRIQGGNVGIGTTSPGSKLSIVGDMFNTGNILSQGTQDFQGGSILIRNLSGKQITLGQSGTNDYIQIEGGGVLEFNHLGDFPVTWFFNGGNVGIGTTSPGAKLEINGQVKITGGALGAGKVLTSDGSGLASWEPTAFAITHYIGESYGGGKVFYVYDNGQHGLIAATADQSTGVQWYNGTYRCTGTISYGGINAGAMNTAMIVATQISDNQTGFFAAKYCADYQVTVGGVTYGDWYLPSQFELDLLYLQKTVVGGFANGYYWSSSEANSNSAWYRNFFDGSLNFNLKVNTYYVRAIRAF